MFGNIPAVRLGLVTTENNRKKNKTRNYFKTKESKETTSKPSHPPHTNNRTVL
tara:strand:- start:26 stop:184 length:159 start_codon:yes stop_codon:yes gene_type:complete